MAAQRAQREHERAGESLPDRDDYLDPRAIGSNPNAPIVKWGANVHLHAHSDKVRPAGWAMPPMEPAGVGPGGLPPSHFFDGASGAYPFDIFDSLFGYGRKNPSGYLDRLGVAMSAMDAVSSILGSMPVYGVKKLQVVPLPSWRHTPDEDTYASWQEFLEQVVLSVLSRGEVFLWAVARYSDSMLPRRFVVLNPSWVSISTDGNGRRTFYLGDDKLDPGDVLHIRYKSQPGELHGIGPLEWMARQIAGAEILRSYVENVAQYGVPAILTNPDSMDAQQARDLKARFMESMRSPGEPAVLAGGLSYSGGGGLSPENLAAVDMLGATEAKIVAAIAATPPHIVGVHPPSTSSLTYQNLHSMTAGWWRIGLRPLASRLMGAMSNWLLPYGTSMELNRDDFIRPADPAVMASYYKTMSEIRNPVDVNGNGGEPALTVDEIRVEERLTPHMGAGPGQHAELPIEERYLDAQGLSGANT